MKTRQEIIHALANLQLEVKANNHKTDPTVRDAVRMAVVVGKIEALMWTVGAIKEEVKK